VDPPDLPGRRLAVGTATGGRIRRPHEPEWLKKNAPRLWPNLFGLARTRGRGENQYVRTTLFTGGIVVRLSWWQPDPTERFPRQQALVGCNVRIRAERGVTGRVTFSFVRAVVVAPVAAADEPHAPLSLTGIPHHAVEYEGDGGGLFAFRRPFELRGLADVWARLPDPSYRTGGLRDGEPYKRLVNANGSLRTAEAEAVVNKAMTDWARDRAANPLAVFREETAT
jgi:hypothetical protein